MGLFANTRVRKLGLSDCVACEQIQRVVWDRDDSCSRDYISANQFQKHILIFPDGQFVIENSSGIIGHCSTIRTDRAIDLTTDDWYTITGYGTFTTHEPFGKTLLIADICLLPSYVDNFKDLIWRILYYAKSGGVERLLEIFPVRISEDAGTDIIELDDRNFLQQRIELGFTPIGFRTNYRFDRSCVLLEKIL